MKPLGLACFFLSLLCATHAGGAAPVYRQPVLQQVTMPHAYYWRGLYIPQLTSGPSAATFSPDGLELIYSMAGSLWRQRIGSPDSYELTAGRGYDYQPDWSSDGKTVVFARHEEDCIELYQLRLADGTTSRLTSFRAVSLEPRISPDGRQLAFVSSKAGGYFDLYVADLTEAGLANIRPLVQGRKTQLTRYYYGPLDHAINPSWSPDGRQLLYVSNPEVAWGTGDVWSVTVADPSQKRKVFSEETSWQARPELAPDGRRILFSSYHGRQWHQLWLTTLEGSAPLPLTFGDFDRRGARWSPDGERILYISNESQNVSLWVQEVIGGKRLQIVPATRHYLRPMGLLQVTITSAGEPTPARVSVLSMADGRHYGADDARIMADDSFIPTVQAHETHYFRCDGRCEVRAPAGALQITVLHGLESNPVRRLVQLTGKGASESIALQPLALPSHFGPWISADLHVHMNYGGAYRLTAPTLAADAQAEDLDVVYNLIVNKEQRIPGIGEFSAAPARFGNVTLYQSQETHTSYWGHLGLLHLQQGIVLPDFAGYQHTALASPYPHNGVLADLAHEQGALVGYVHPFDTSIANLDALATLSHTLPVDVALGKTDYIEIVSFADHAATAHVWHRLLNLGFRVPAGAGTDAMANYASLRGPLGINRVYLRTAATDPDSLKKALAAGHGFVTNAPLLGLDVNGSGPGEQIVLGAGARKVHVRASMRSIAPIDAVELVLNGKVIRRIRPTRGGLSADFEGDVRVDRGGWLLLRASNANAQVDVQDFYPYGTTNPVWLQKPEGPPAAGADAEYFLKWIDLVTRSAAARPDYNSTAEREKTLTYLSDGRRVFEKLAREARAASRR